MPATRFAAASRRVSSARGLAPPTSTGRPSGPVTSRGPRTRYRTRRDPRRIRGRGGALSVRNRLPGHASRRPSGLQVRVKWPPPGSSPSAGSPRPRRRDVAEGSTPMSITELHDEPEFTNAPVLEDAPLDSLAPAIPAADVEDLRSRVHGPVYAAGDDGLATEVATWNLAVTQTPALAVGATCATDVAAAVSWAAAHGLEVAVQATGHGPVRNAAGSVLVST